LIFRRRLPIPRVYIIDGPRIRTCEGTVEEARKSRELVYSLHLDKIRNEVVGGDSRQNANAVKQS